MTRRAALSAACSSLAVIPSRNASVLLPQEPETATHEALEHFRYHGLPISSALPKVMVAVRVKIDMESASQALGWAAYAAGFQGLRVPSKADPKGANVLVFPQNLTRRCRLEVMNADDLDKLGKPA